MSLLFIFAASPMEAQPIRKIAAPTPDSNSHLRCGPNELVLITSDMGPISAKNRAEAALGLTSGSAPDRKPDGIFVIGLCGGLSANLSEGKIVAYAECLSTDTTNPRMT